MSISLTASGKILLEGECPHEEAEQLLQLLLSTPGAVVDWRPCTSAHSAVIQVLLAPRHPCWDPRLAPRSHDGCTPT